MGLKQQIEDVVFCCESKTNKKQAQMNKTKETAGLS
jgi:hypothetical protein